METKFKSLPHHSYPIGLVLYGSMMLAQALLLQCTFNQWEGGIEGDNHRL